MLFSPKPTWVLVTSMFVARGTHIYMKYYVQKSSKQYLVQVSIQKSMEALWVLSKVVLKHIMLLNSIGPS